jgi:hypothetical protein
MSSYKGKSKYMDNVTIADGVKYTHPSKKHYRPACRFINRKIEHFDNDVMWLVLETKIETIDLEFGINKDRWKFSDFDNNDEYKEGNRR